MWKLNPAMRLRCPSPSERIECRRSNRTAAYQRRKIMKTYYYGKIMPTYHYDDSVLDRVKAFGRLSRAQEEDLMIAMTNVSNSPEEWDTEDEDETRRGYIEAIRTELEMFSENASEFGEGSESDTALLELFNRAYPEPDE